MTRTLLFALVLGAALTPSDAEASPSLHWSSPVPFDTAGAPSAVSCASESLCVAVDSKGNAFSTSDPTASSPSWSEAEVDHGEALTAVSCAPSGACVAVDGHGHAFASAAPGLIAWTQSSIPNGGKALTGVSCPSSSLCVAVDEEGDVATSTSPASGVWKLASSHPGHHLTAVSCSSPTLCLALDSSGDALTSESPTAAAPWRLQKIDSAELRAISCSLAGACVAVDATGEVLASADPAVSAATWSQTPIDESESLGAISCTSTGLCVAVNAHGKALASDDPAQTIPTWGASSADAGPPAEPLTGVSCLAGGFCLAVDLAGRAVAGRVPVPLATTLAAEPAEVTATGATLHGLVDPNDAALGACTFEYGTSASYTQSIPCSLPMPAATGGLQGVSAQLIGLSPNTTYHFRVLASSPAGAAVGADESFTTPTSSQVALVHPSPSISGTPATGQRLTCHPGLPTGASAQLTYAWLRDLIPIQGAIASTYMVKGQDGGHHLQCQVTATDGGGSATAKSAFVTIPVGGVPESAGETAVGRAAFRNGRVSVPVACSAQASNGCQVTLRLTAVETLSGSRVVAIAAHASRRVRGIAAVLHQGTITLANVRVHLAQGARATITAALGASARRLLRAMRRFTAYARVSGTVIGVIEAQLSQQLVTLSTPSHGASTHAARRR
jgi:hypothetical protein